MREVFIVSPNYYGVEKFAEKARSLGWSPLENPDAVTLRGGEEYVDFRETPNIAHHYDEEELGIVNVCGVNPRFFSIRFRDHKAAARTIMGILPASPNFILDNDHGLLLPLDQFSTIKPMDWDWSIAASLYP